MGQSRDADCLARPMALRLALTGREDPMRTNFILGRQTLIPAARPGMALWRQALFAAMVRLSGSAMEYFRLPPGRVVELGSQIEI
jgi:KUP system potassium uptake protein